MTKKNAIISSVIILLALGIAGFFSLKLYAQSTKSAGSTSQTESDEFKNNQHTQAPTTHDGEVQGDEDSNKELDPARTLILPILMYHHVGPLPEKADKVTTGLTVSPADFEAQVAWLRKQGYNSISLEELYLHTQGKFNLPNKPIVFTFDDGYLNVFQNAIPILKKYEYKGSFGIITQWTGAVNGTNVYATWADISKAKDEGMEIVSHTQTHFDGTNPKFDANFILDNLSGSILDIYSHLGVRTNILIYPYGHSTPIYRAKAKEAGFVMGITTQNGAKINLDDLMQIPRIRVNHLESLEKFEKILNEAISK